MVTAHVLRRTCFRFPAGISYTHLWTFSKTIYSPWNTFFLQTVKWSFPSFKKLCNSIHPPVFWNWLANWQLLLSLCVCFWGVVWFFFGSAWTRNTHCYSSLSPHCVTPIKVHLPFFLHWWNLFWSKIKQKVMSAAQVNGSYIQVSIFYP